MPRWIDDPSLLDGEELDRWYRRTPEDVATERRVREDLRREAYLATEARLGDRPGVAQNENGPELVDRNLVWVSPRPDHWRAVDLDAPGPPDTGLWLEARGAVPAPPPELAELAPPPAPRMGPRLDTAVIPPRAAPGSFFSQFSIVPNPELGGAFLTDLPAPLGSVTPKIGGWYELQDGRRVTGAEVDRIYQEQVARIAGTDEGEPAAYAVSVDRLPTGKIPRAGELKKGEREIDPTCSEFGGWELDPQFPNYAEHTKRYEAQITGAPGLDYVVRNPGEKPVKFDGCDVTSPGHPLLEAKGPGYAALLVKARRWNFGGNILNGVQKQMSRQDRAAHGHPIEWYVAEPDPASAMRNMSPLSITVFHEPPR